ncbi:YbaB/EbfC family nucleoid-associated protein [Mycobacteroides sp. LB1]|uniref:YbaB/EbfC family nucleoid-associated protein n=1 Tax=Mycobacteroides sp. LB1 TaxID=2750814 RepID=UPI0015E02FC7|nr:YbaB/EbfC family nucleoid-associated protein [Mycobacteroides sp. LB1]
MDNDALRHELVDALALVQEHMNDLAALEEKRAALSATVTVADATVAVTVDADGVVIQTVVDESYIDEHDLTDLGSYVTAAAQEAANDVEWQLAEMLQPIAERREQFPSLSEIVNGAPDIRELVPDFFKIQHSPYPTARSKR